MSLPGPVGKAYMRVGNFSEVYLQDRRKDQGAFPAEYAYPSLARYGA